MYHQELGPRRGKWSALFAAMSVLLLCAATAVGQQDQQAQRDEQAPPAKGHLLATFSWSISNICDIAIVPGLLNLLTEVAPELPVVVMTSQRATSPAFATMQEYLPRYSPNCRVVAYPFLLGSDTNAGASIDETPITPSISVIS